MSTYKESREYNKHSNQIGINIKLIRINYQAAGAQCEVEWMRLHHVHLRELQHSLDGGVPRNPRRPVTPLAY